MATHISGASVWEQEVYDHLCGHADTEREAIAAYRTMAEESPSPAIRYLATMILEDEGRHHRMFADLAETVRRSAELAGEPLPIPDLSFIGEKERAAILEVTERFLDLERDDLKELKQLAKLVKPVAETTLWGLFVALMEADSVKHIHILEFIRDRARHSLT